MKLLCRWLGHKPVPGWSGEVPYLRIVGTNLDAIGQVHAYLDVECRRCGKWFRIGNVHLPKCTRVHVDEPGKRWVIRS